MFLYLTAQCSELAQGYYQVVKNIAEAVVSCDHCTLSASKRKPNTSLENMTKT